MEGWLRSRRGGGKGELAEDTPSPIGDTLPKEGNYTMKGHTMPKKNLDKIFDKYNPASAVTRCPKGRSQFRSLLDDYANASVHLYGVISKQEFVEIFNSQNAEQTDTDEVFTLLLPLVIKKSEYCFYKDYIVYDILLDDTNEIEQFIKDQADKPRYLPAKEDFLKYKNGGYMDKTEYSFWTTLIDFTFENWDDEEADIFGFIFTLRLIALYNVLHEVNIFSFFEAHGLQLKDERQLKKFTDIFMVAYNNTRCWPNKGYSPVQMAKLIDSQTSQMGTDDYRIVQSKKIGVNEPCPCGSGKKYKKCCMILTKASNSHLTVAELSLFVETWYGLMDFVNKEKKVISNDVQMNSSRTIFDECNVKIREVLWENPKLITKYIASEKLPTEKVSLLKSWRDHHIKGTFMVWKYTPEYAIMTGEKKTKVPKIYAVKGIRKHISEVLQKEIPLAVETVLIPFMDKIIFDTFIAPYPVSFNINGERLGTQEIDDDIQKYGIITRLG